MEVGIASVHLHNEEVLAMHASKIERGCEGRNLSYYVCAESGKGECCFVQKRRKIGLGGRGVMVALETCFQTKDQIFFSPSYLDRMAVWLDSQSC